VRSSLLLVLVAAFVLGYLLGRRRPYLFQNDGEARLAKAVMSNFKPPDYHLLNHLTFCTEDGTTQVDHILVCRFGVFVIETKHYSGWLFGGLNDQTWTQVHFARKFRFQNPIRQNYKHLAVVKG
jgi:restriction system protein